VLQEAFPFSVASDDEDKTFKGRLFTKSFAADLQAAVANRWSMLYFVLMLLHLHIAL
jgi:hypothetical protein